MIRGARPAAHPGAGRPRGSGSGRFRLVGGLTAFVLVLSVACGSGGDGGDSSGGAGLRSTTPDAVGGPAAVPTSLPPADCPAGPPDRLVPQVLAEHPHDPTAFTQGLLFVDGEVVEGTGLVGRSSVRRVDLATGEVRSSVPVPGGEFGEGVARAADGRFVQLTWRDGVAFVRDPTTLEVVETWPYEGEGWGLTTLSDGTFVQSDGSDTLTLRDATTFAPLERVRVVRSDGPADQLNELEWDGTSLWANRWQADEILRIDLRCGRVDAVVDVTALSEDVRARPVPEGLQPPEVLNGVAHVPGTDRFLITGKLWPVLHEVRLVPVGSGSPR